MNYKILLSAFIGLVFMFIGGLSVRADTYTSTNFKVLDPVIGAGGQRTTSDNYILQQSLGEAALGKSTSSNFKINSGFLTWPFSSPASNVRATAGDGQVTISWTAGTANLGWVLSGYSIGQSTTSGGSYAYSSKGNVTSATITNLINNITYYFVVINEDFFGNYIATSAEVSAKPISTAPVCGDHSCNGSETCATCPADCGSCGGGGGGGDGSLPPAITTKVIFTGRAFPKNAVTLLKDAQVSATTIAGADANFQISLSGLSGGNYLFSVYGEDYQGIRSSLLTFPVSVTAGVTTTVGGIFIAPTIAVDKSEVKRGDNIAIFGQSVPNSQITISVNSDQEFFEKTTADKNGIYLYNFDTDPLDKGQHFTKSKSAVSGEISSFSLAMSFLVGTKNVAAELPTKKALKGDLNSDGRVNLVDFSIAAYWYKRPLSTAFKPIEIERLNGDGKIDLVDFSIMAYYWTG